jgi:hypothetical protein
MEQRFRSVLVVLLAGASLSASAQTSGATATSADGLEALTVPAAMLPSTCRLTPLTSDGPKSPFGTNPAIVTDAKLLSRMYMMAAGASEPSETAIESGYAGYYREEGGSPEIGVHALRFKKPPTETEAQRFRTAQGRGGDSALRLVKGSIAIFAWSDARANAPDRGCFDVVRRHLERAEVK